MQNTSALEAWLITIPGFVHSLQQNTHSDLLCATADGNEGGRHHLITAAVGNGNLYIMKVQIGDKRWFKGARKDAEGAWNSFTVA